MRENSTEQLLEITSDRYKPKALGNSLDLGLPNGCDLESQFKYQKGLETSTYIRGTPVLICLSSLRRADFGMGHREQVLFPSLL